MQSVLGYYDGTTIRPIGRIKAKPNQKVIITITDEFVEPVKKNQSKGMRGALEKYANPRLAEKENGAWERAAVEKYGNL